MIFSAAHMFIRMFKENNPNYSDIGLGFLIIGSIESFFWIMILLVVMGVRA